MTRAPLPPGWRESTLDAVLAEPLANGRSVITRDGGFPVLRLTAIKNGGINLGERKGGDWTIEEARPFLVAPNDFLISRGSGSLEQLGRGALVGRRVDPVAFPDTMIRVRVQPGVVSARYLEYLWNTPDVRRQILSSARTTAGIYKINQQAIGRMRIVRPPLDEQVRIVHVLDAIDALRERRRSALRLTEELASAVFREMFGDPAINSREWPTSTLRDMSTLFSDGPFGSNLKSSHYVKDGVRVIRLQNIGSGSFIDNDRACVSQEHFASLSRHTCLPGDVLIATLGDPNIRACLQPEWLAVALNKADCVRMRVDSSVAHPRFVCALLNEPSVESMARSAIVGQTRLRISSGRLAALRVPLPPLDRQVVFAERVASLDARTSRHQAHLAELDALFASVQHRAFTGTLFAADNSPQP